MDYLEFESFFHQLVPLTDQERRIMTDMGPNGNNSAQEVPPPQSGMFLPNYNNEDKKGKTATPL
jgi:hypothetical protein